MFFLLYIFVPLDGQAIQLNYLVVDDEPLVPQDLEDILKKGPAGVPDILQKSGNNLAVNPQAFDCDYYRFIQGDITAINQYRGDYLVSYSWAELSIGVFDSEIK